jgi:hypothetical protein
MWQLFAIRTPTCYRIPDSPTHKLIAHHGWFPMNQEQGIQSNHGHRMRVTHYMYAYKMCFVSGIGESYLEGGE